MDNRLKLYIDDVRQLAKTIVIKSMEAAASINQDLIEKGIDVSDDKTTWKYYLNISGQYHPTDSVMTVVSMDTQETIVFSKENLLIHRATARAYVYGTRAYTELLSAYPNQEKLMLGILYPVDMATAIDAPNFSILGYPDSLVQENEYNFIAKLQNWIDGFVARWFVRGFTVTDSHYMATVFMILFVYLVPAIMEIRLAACKTQEAHSFHVKKYLASHGLNEDYLDYLTLEQSLWLYRNIEYLQHNLGKQANFNLLMDNLMTKRKLPLANYTMRHDLSVMPDNIYPDVIFRRQTLNYNNLDLVPTILTVEQILDKQDGFARSNASSKEEVLPVIREVMENSPSNTLATKYLESTVTDYGDNTPYTLLKVLMGHWPYLAAKGLYTAFVQVTNPRTDEQFTINAKDAFILTCYAFAKACGFEPDYVPEPLAERVQRIPTPQPSDLMAIVDKDLVMIEDAQRLLSRQPALSKIISIDTFYQTCQEIYRAEQLQRGLMALEEHPVKRAMIQNMAARIYCDTKCVLVPSKTAYSTWLAEKNIDLSNFTDSDYESMYQAIILDATGLSLVQKTSIKAIQNAMVSLFMGLSSYSIQIKAEVNGTDLIVLDTPQVRLAVDELKTHDYDALQEIVCDIKDVSLVQHDVFEGDINAQPNNDILLVHEHMGAISYDTSVNLSMADGGRSTHMTFELPMMKLRLAQPLPKNNRGLIDVPGLAEWLALPLDQQMDVIDMYDSGLPPVIPPKDYDDPNDIENVLRYQTLSGLKYDPDQQQ